MKKRFKRPYRSTIVDLKLVAYSDLIEELVCREKVQEINNKLQDAYDELRKRMDILESFFLKYRKFKKGVNEEKNNFNILSSKFYVLKKEIDTLKVKNVNILEINNEQINPEKVSVFLNKASLLLKLYALTYNIYDIEEEIEDIFPNIIPINHKYDVSLSQPRRNRRNKYKSLKKINGSIGDVDLTKFSFADFKSMSSIDNSIGKIIRITDPDEKKNNDKRKGK